MIDIHSHIIPCFDDGSSSIEMTKNILDRYIECGVDSVILTPHQNKNNKNKEELITLFTKFKEDFKDYNINFYLGSEIYYYEDLLKDLKNNICLTMNNTNKVLIEFSTRVETNISDVIYELVINGFVPIIAHIERYNYLTFDDYVDIKNLGALIQVNASSFTKREYKKIIKFLLKNKLLDFVASDVHNDSNRNVDFSYCKKFIFKKYKDQFDYIFNKGL